MGKEGEGKMKNEAETTYGGYREHTGWHFYWLKDLAARIRRYRLKKRPKLSFFEQQAVKHGGSVGGVYSGKNELFGTKPIEKERVMQEVAAKTALKEKYEEKMRLKAEQEEHQRQLQEEKAQRIMRQEEIRLNEMRARERRLAEERAQQKRGRR